MTVPLIGLVSAPLKDVPFLTADISAPVLCEFGKALKAVYLPCGDEFLRIVG